MNTTKQITDARVVRAGPAVGCAADLRFRRHRYGPDFAVLGYAVKESLPVFLVIQRVAVF